MTTHVGWARLGPGEWSDTVRRPDGDLVIVFAEQLKSRKQAPRRKHAVKLTFAAARQAGWKTPVALPAAAAAGVRHVTLKSAATAGLTTAAMSAAIVTGPAMLHQAGPHAPGPGNGHAPAVLSLGGPGRHARTRRPGEGSGSRRAGASPAAPASPGTAPQPSPPPGVSAGAGTTPLRLGKHLTVPGVNVHVQVPVQLPVQVHQCVDALGLAQACLGI